ncbi:virulence factor family protein [Pseudomonas sp. LRF_L74]|uniref:virulence factor family protein n=1 Tax=Pseudomonas sp. LRF_L74 TaxID=3369422 RepID=UPI003F60BB23
MRKRHLLFIAPLAILGIGLLLWTRPPAQAHLEHPTMVDGIPATLALAPGKAKSRVLLVNPDKQRLSDETLLELAQQSNANLLQVTMVAGNCTGQQQYLKSAREKLGGEPTLVTGIGPGAAFAWRWLASQDNDQATALSVGFDLAQPDCPTQLPEKAPHGHWIAAWNDGPEDPTALFARNQESAETSISDYDTQLPTLLQEKLSNLLRGEGEPMPVLEEPATGKSDTVTLFYSGDGGWRDLDRAAAEDMAKQGWPVVGIDALRYFWQHKSPQQGASDLSHLMKTYREKWGAKRFVLIGYSFGADVLPAFYNRLPAADQQQIDGIFLLAFARSGSFEIEVEGWLGKAGEEAATGPEMARLPAAKVLCIYGAEEKDESGCTQPGAVGEVVQLPGGHHFDENYPALAQRLMDAIRKRQP